MHPVRTWNKKVIIASFILVVSILGYRQISLAAHLVQTATASLPIPSVIWVFLSSFLTAVPFVAAFFFAFAAIRTIDKTKEKGRPLGSIILGIASIIILVQLLLLYFSIGIVQVNTGASVSQLAERARDPQATQKMAMNASKAGAMRWAQRFIQHYYETNHSYPRDTTTINQLQKQSGNQNEIHWEWGVEYFPLDNYSRYILRAQLETDYNELLKEPRDIDGMVGTVDCSDEQMYLCYGPEQ